MSFEPNRWKDGAAGGTPITAAELNRIEEAGREAATVVPEHTHDASDVTSGTFSTARIPNLGQSKVTGLSGVLESKADQTALDALVNRIETLETKVEELETPDE